MKNFFTGILTVLTTMTISCSEMIKTPEWYEEEIQDAVKFYIAEADYIIDKSQDFLFLLGELFSSDTFEERCDEMESVFIDLYTNSDMTYRQALEFVAQQDDSDFQNDARHILEHYDNLYISLSDYAPSSTRADYKCWTFKELHTGIVFLFEIRDLQSDIPTWTCSPVMESYLNYVTNSL